ncbi:MAG: hypothetical protein ACK5VI_04635 [Opitutia bacterium]|jgi:hypothetical protein
MRPFFLPLLLSAACPGADVIPMWWTDPPSPAPELATAEAGGRPRPIRLLALCPLESAKGVPGEPWRLLRKEAPSGPDQPPGWTPYVEVRLAADAKRVAVLVVPSSPPRAMAIELSDQGHPWGSVRLVNLTGDPVQGWVGRRRLNLAPGGQASSEAASGRRTEELVLLAPTQGGQPRILLSSRVILDPDRRSLVFVARLPDGRVETRALEESKAETAESPPER